MVESVIQFAGARNHEQLVAREGPANLASEDRGILNEAEYPQDCSEHADFKKCVLILGAKRAKRCDIAFDLAARPCCYSHASSIRDIGFVGADAGIRTSFWV
jgi:hypothetical protein